jgi:hypothetical protein
VWLAVQATTTVLVKIYATEENAEIPVLLVKLAVPMHYVSLKTRKKFATVLQGLLEFQQLHKDALEFLNDVRHLSLVLQGTNV